MYRLALLCCFLPLASFAAEPTYALKVAEQTPPPEEVSAALRAVLSDTCLDLVDGEGSRSPHGNLAGQRIAAFCGIGNPEGFRQTLLTMGPELCEFRVYPDHHSYSAADVAALQHWAGDLKANLVLTTQKDLVKLRTGSLGAAPLRALRIGLEIVAGGDVMDDALARLLPESRRGGPV